MVSSVDVVSFTESSFLSFSSASDSLVEGLSVVLLSVALAMVITQSEMVKV